MESMGRFALTITAVGLGIVFLVQMAIAVVVGILKRLDARWQAHEASRDAAALERQQTLDDTTLVLVSAAVATMIAGRSRIRSVRRLLPADAPSSPWSAQGRAVLQGSHIIARKRDGR